MQWVDRPKKTGGDGTGNDDRGMKSAGNGTIVERGTPQLNVQELGQEQQLTLHKHETQEAFQNTKGRRRGSYRNLRRRCRRRFRNTSESSSFRRGKRNLHRGREIWRGPHPRCVSSPSTAISRPYYHHVRGVENSTPVWREKRCIVSCRGSKPKRKTA